jgi:hypothetical protein
METFETLFYLAGGIIALAIACYLLWLVMRMAEDIHAIRKHLDAKK